MGNRRIIVSGSAKMSGSPDWVTISFNINSRNYDYGKCLEHLASQTDTLREELQAVKIEKENIKTSGFDISTEFDRFKERKIFKGYSASHRVKVEIAFDKSYLNDVLNVLSSTQSHASFHINFSIKDPEPLRQKAIAAAVRNSKEKALLLAKEAGVELDEVIQIDYSWSELRIQSDFRLDDMACASEAPSFDFTPEDADISESVTVSWSII